MLSRFFSSNKKSKNNSSNNDLNTIDQSLDISIIISCRNEINTLKKTIDSILNSKNVLSFEIIIVDDGSTDNSCSFVYTNDNYKNIKLIFSKNIGVAAARNLGTKSSKGKYLFFCDAHISVPDYWLDSMVRTLKESNGDAVIPAIKNMETEDRGYGGTWNTNLEFIWLGKPDSSYAEIPLAPGCILGIKKDIFETIGGFDNHLKLYGVEDQEFSLKLWLFGYKILIDTSIEVNHLFKIYDSYKITYSDLIYNYLCLAYLHFDYNNLVKILELFKSKPNFNIAFTNLMLNEDLLKQRKKYFIKRKFDENYFFKKFNIHF
ncbi:glycosyltransferase family 2 protein [Clostridium magnum]|uniref:Putative glycosyltransferase EpsH n=1 Tax=Clostridium magnum DSM 2767 TaxID=1121326 RepID=A0A162U9G7_9CLOT|nr:glycosyltransferase [Clostridium magnum]KZL93670.1 putative glycosyltransferase EpsH [Clostridium magnum DSM 2767]SHI92898.1 Glycosyltransferase, GT2 family [Clostridium magnum DSM 2767]